MQARKPIIKHIITLGDSLSDRGTMNKRHLAGVIPMSYLTGLHWNSPLGEFTNGHTWDDHFAAIMASEFLITHYREKHQIISTEISDDVIVKGNIQQKNQSNYHLDDDKLVDYHDQNFMRNYNEGGLTSYNYKGRFTLNFLNMMTEVIVSCLDEQRKKLLNDDKIKSLDENYKKETLVIEWSGANDLITVNSKPTNEAAEFAVMTRINNIKELMKNGYTQFVLFNLPDLSLTPRFQMKSENDQQDARNVCDYFNRRLNEECEKLKKESDNELFLDVFDVNAIFTKVYNDPTKQGFEKDKLKTPFIKSKDFNIQDHLSPATGYMFWDDVHPSADVHAILAKEFYKKYSSSLVFEAPILKQHLPPAEIYYIRFMDKYNELYKVKKSFSFSPSSPILDFSRKKDLKSGLNLHAQSQEHAHVLLNIFDTIENKTLLDSQAKQNLKTLQQLGWLEPVPTGYKKEMVYIVKVEIKNALISNHVHFVETSVNSPY